MRVDSVARFIMCLNLGPQRFPVLLSITPEYNVRRRLFPECFSEQPPVAAITYEWRLSFQDILSYFSPAQASLAAPSAACVCAWGQGGQMRSQHRK